MPITLVDVVICSVSAGDIYRCFCCASSKTTIIRSILDIWLIRDQIHERQLDAFAHFWAGATRATSVGADVMQFVSIDQCPQRSAVAGIFACAKYRACALKHT